jgi:hypothetical protein
MNGAIDLAILNHQPQMESFTQSTEWLSTTTKEKRAHALIKKCLHDLDQVTMGYVLQRNGDGLVELSETLKQIVEIHKNP